MGFLSAWCHTDLLYTLTTRLPYLPTASGFYNLSASLVRLGRRRCDKHKAYLEKDSLDYEEKTRPQQWNFSLKEHSTLLHTRPGIQVGERIDLIQMTKVINTPKTEKLKAKYSGSICSWLHSSGRPYIQEFMNSKLVSIGLKKKKERTQVACREVEWIWEELRKWSKYDWNTFYDILKGFFFNKRWREEAGNNFYETELLIPPLHKAKWWCYIIPFTPW